MTRPLNEYTDALTRLYEATDDGDFEGSFDTLNEALAELKALRAVAEAADCVNRYSYTGRDYWEIHKSHIMKLHDALEAWRRTSSAPSTGGSDGP